MSFLFHSFLNLRHFGLSWNLCNPRAILHLATFNLLRLQTPQLWSPLIVIWTLGIYLECAWWSSSLVNKSLFVPDASSSPIRPFPVFPEEFDFVKLWMSSKLILDLSARDCTSFMKEEGFKLSWKESLRKEPSSTEYLISSFCICSWRYTIL